MKSVFAFYYYIFIFFALLLILPLFIIISLIIFLSSGSPVIFKQERIGEKGNIFTIFKFRTMTKDAQKQKIKYLKLNEAQFPVFKIRNDPRFTYIGRFLSHTGLDELPQVFNILKGEMALFGPRPLPVYEYKKLKHWQKKRQNGKPGIISPWILNGYHQQSFDEWMKSDIEYIQNKSPGYDIGLFFKTALFMLKMLFGEIF